MTRTWLSALLWTVFFLVIAGDAGSMGRRADRIAPPDQSARKLIQHITVADPYTKWSVLPGTEMFKQGTQPHGPQITLYANEPAFKSMSGGIVFAPGSILVIENYTADRKLIAFGVMYKLPGFNPDDGDWYWLRSTPDDRVDVFGKAQACIDCHRAAK